MERRSLRRLVRPLLFAAFTLLLAACAKDAPQDALSPEAPIARQIDSLFRPVFWIAAAIFFLVEGAIVFAAIRFRDRGAGHEEPKQTHGNTKLEFGWTLIPALLLLGISIPTVITIFDLDSGQASDDLVIDVTAKQWWWEYVYPDSGTPPIVTANEMVIPTGKRVFLNLESTDVIHSFWIPKLAGKQDVVPGRTNTLQLLADQPGWYEGQCAEYCGLSHANMRLRVRAVTPAEFDVWVREQLAPAARPGAGSARDGFELFFDPTFNERLGKDACILCHAIKGTDATARVGPDLTHFASREMFAGAILLNNDANVHDWIRNTRALKPGVVMPIFQGTLTEEEIALLTAYLRSLT